MPWWLMETKRFSGATLIGSMHIRQLDYFRSWHEAERLKRREVWYEREADIASSDLLTINSYKYRWCKKCFEGAARKAGIRFFGKRYY